jgi:SAM-dependent methyltransferase
MPRILRTVIPRIKKSIEERGLRVSLGRSVLLPLHLLREYQESLQLHPLPETSPFDREHGVETDGELDGWVYLSDLEIPSSNWIHGTNYAAIEPEQFRAILSSLALRFQDFVFVDFGSGKGRALLLASEFPFKKIVGIEFSPELHAVAQRNIAKYNLAQRRCASVESVYMDFLEFPLPLEPSVFFLFDPCDAFVLGKLMAKVTESLRAHPRELYLVYVSPTGTKEQLLDSTGCLTKLVRNAEQYFCVYKAR